MKAMFDGNTKIITNFGIRKLSDFKDGQKILVASFIGAEEATIKRVTGKMSAFKIIVDDKRFGEKTIISSNASYSLRDIDDEYFGYREGDSYISENDILIGPPIKHLYNRDSYYEYLRYSRYSYLAQVSDEYETDYYFQLGKMIGYHTRLLLNGAIPVLLGGRNPRHAKFEYGLDTVEKKKQYDSTVHEDFYIMDLNIRRQDPESYAVEYEATQRGTIDRNHVIDFLSRKGWKNLHHTNEAKQLVAGLLNNYTYCIRKNNYIKNLKTYNKIVAEMISDILWIGGYYYTSFKKCNGYFEFEFPKPIERVDVKKFGFDELGFETMHISSRCTVTSVEEIYADELFMIEGPTTALLDMDGCIIYVDLDDDFLDDEDDDDYGGGGKDDDDYGGGGKDDDDGDKEPEHSETTIMVVSPYTTTLSKH